MLKKLANLKTRKTWEKLKNLGGNSEMLKKLENLKY